MGKSGFRIMLYKLRDFARKSPNNQQAGNNKDIKIERTISLPRSSYYHKFAAATAAAAASSSSPSQGLARHELESPAVPNYGKDEKKIRKDKGKLVRGKSNNMPGRSSTLIDTRVSAGCSCRAKVGSKGEKVAKKKSSASKNHVLKKNLQVFEMEKQGNPKCSRSMEILKQRNKGIIQEIEKEYSDAPTAKVSFDGAVKEKIRLGFQSLQEDQALENNDNERDNARKCFGGALKHDEGSVFESPEAQPVLKSYNRNINNGKRCSAFCCSCRLSISDSIDEFDETPLDVDIWSEKEDCESEDLQLPFLTKSDRVVLDMKINFSTEEMRESNVGLFRRNDAAAHAQVQAKLGQMIQEKGSKKKKNNVAPANFTSNGKDFHISAKEASSGPETEHSLSPEAKNEVRVHQIDEVEGNYEGRAKIDRRRGNLRSSEPKIDQKCKGTVNLAQKKISESLAIVKCSYDPWRDFKESMVEMIQENDIRDSQDLKELLHCYICLNSHEYHDVIFQVFEQVRLDLRMLRASC